MDLILGKRLFGTCGIRGPIDTKVTPEVVHRLARALSTYMKGGKIVLAADTRESAGMLRHSMTSGFLASGVDVVDIGVVTTPCLAYTTGEMDANAGVMITASHNPAQDNGVKFHNPDGMEYLPEQELELERIFFEDNFRKVEWNRLGERRFCPEAKDIYINSILEEVEVEPGTRVVLDCASGAASTIVPYALRKLGCDVVTLNSVPDGRFPAHSPEPQPWNLEDVKNYLRNDGAEIGFVHDGDGDRVVFFDENGRFIKHDEILTLFAKHILEENPGGIVATGINTSSSIGEVARTNDAKLVRIPLGDLPAALSRHDPVYVCEPAKPIFPKVNRWVDGLYTAVKMLEIMSIQSESISELISEIPSCELYRENFSCPNEKKEQFMEEIKDYLVGEVENVEDVIEVDGLRIDREDGSWILVRTSGTEPKVRMVVEGKEEDQVEELKRIGRRGIEKILLEE